ncbi:hypothetical protein Cp1R7AA1_108 [Mesorhizobium phage Cp1R7A-A1]|nr:hypothetical protein Cp1R7AA1_108 [Mesorhizobium phage Cp1R7A-A1]
MSERIKLDHFVVVGANAWGKAESVEKAFWNWWKEARPGSGGFYSPAECTIHIRQVDAEAHVDGMGSLNARKIVNLGDVKLTKEVIAAYRKAEDMIDGLLDPARDKTDMDAELEGVEIGG